MGGSVAILAQALLKLVFLVHRLPASLCPRPWRFAGCCGGVAGADAGGAYDRVRGHDCGGHFASSCWRLVLHWERHIPRLEFHVVEPTFGPLSSSTCCASSLCSLSWCSSCSRSSSPTCSSSCWRLLLLQSCSSLWRSSCSSSRVEVLAATRLAWELTAQFGHLFRCEAACSA